MSTRTCIQPRSGQQLVFEQVPAEEFVAPAGWNADVATICRAFHQLDRRLVLERLGSPAAPVVWVAILGD